MPDKLFAVYLGGRAPRCNTELHDVVFVVGPSIEATYEQLMDLWFGSPERLHLDSFMALDVVDGHRVSLAAQRPAGDAKALYFINLGGYADGLFTELHANMLVVAASAAEAKGPRQARTHAGRRARGCTPTTSTMSTIASRFRGSGGHHVILEPAETAEPPRPVNGYNVIPEVGDRGLSLAPSRASVERGGLPACVDPATYHMMNETSRPRFGRPFAWALQTHARSLHGARRRQRRGTRRRQEGVSAPRQEVSSRPEQGAEGEGPLRRGRLRL